MLCSSLLSAPPPPPPPPFSFFEFIPPRRRVISSPPDAIFACNGRRSISSHRRQFCRRRPYARYLFFVLLPSARFSPPLRTEVVNNPSAPRFSSCHRSCVRFSFGEKAPLCPPSLWVFGVWPFFFYPFFSPVIPGACRFASDDECSPLQTVSE